MRVESPLPQQGVLGGIIWNLVESSRISRLRDRMEAEAIVALRDSGIPGKNSEIRIRDL